MMETPLTFLGSEFDNDIYIKRDDLFPFSFGGNKARIALRYFSVMDQGDYDSVVTYGGPDSNLCRVVAQMASQRRMKCVTVMHENGGTDSLNLKLVRLSGAKTVFCPVSRVSRTIEDELEKLRQEGRRPYFIPGGGQGVIGTGAYVECYEEILAYENASGISFDYLFLPSGTGTTQSGIICGLLKHGGSTEVVGISIARTQERGVPVICNNVRAFCMANRISVDDAAIARAVTFLDAYRGGGYGQGNYTDVASYVWRNYALPLDNIYPAKAFSGMGNYLTTNGISGKNVLFLHTGAVPLFFQDSFLRQ